MFEMFESLKGTVLGAVTSSRSLQHREKEKTLK
jgi:hypothetical protein